MTITVHLFIIMWNTNIHAQIAAADCERAAHTMGIGMVKRTWMRFGERRKRSRRQHLGNQMQPNAIDFVCARNVHKIIYHYFPIHKLKYIMLSMLIPIVSVSVCVGSVSRWMDCRVLNAQHRHRNAERISFTAYSEKSTTMPMNSIRISAFAAAICFINK